MDLIETFTFTRKKEGRSFKWFVKNYCQGMLYRTVCRQINTDKASEKVKTFMLQYLKDEEKCKEIEALYRNKK